jgi:hypothetical protein
LVSFPSWIISHRQGVLLHREKKDQDRVKKVLCYIGEADKTTARSMGLNQFIPSTFTTIPHTVILLLNIVSKSFCCSVFLPYAPVFVTENSVGLNLKIARDSDPYSFDTDPYPAFF